MQFKENAEVVTWDGDKVGRIDRVVIDPRTSEVTDLVVKKGLLFTEDKVIPIDRIDSATEDRVVLKEGSGNLEDFSDFQESHYVPVDQADPAEQAGLIRPMAWYYPFPGEGWWGAYPGYGRPPFVVTTEKNIPSGTVPIKEGSKVLGSDGEHVGDVERIYTEPTENRVTHLVIVRGLLSRERKLVPTAWVEEVAEEEIRLSVTKAFIDRLPDYSPAREEGGGASKS